MPPRRKPNHSAASSTSSSKKAIPKQTPNPNPSKYGIQHFFDRHPQTNPSSSPCFPSSSPHFTEEVKDDSAVVEFPTAGSEEGSLRTGKDLGIMMGNEEGVNEEDSRPAEVSPEVANNLAVKRFKFSPGMLIKQSQDDGGDEITWKISPINERLRTVSKNMPEIMKALAESSKLSSFHIRQCSLIKSSEGTGVKIEALASPPLTGTASDRSVLTNLVGAKRVCPDNCEDHGGKVRDAISSCLASLRSPFRTPPSLPYCEDKGNGNGCNRVLSQLGLRQHKKALIELLDQVEDAIFLDESSEGNIEICSSEARGGKQADAPLKVKHDAQVALSSPAPRDDKFLVLEVADKCPSVDSSNRPNKVLRLLNEQSGEERSVSLWDEWVYSVISPGDTVHVIGQFDGNGKCDVNRKKNFLIIHPDLWLSGTRVAASFTCPRRAVFDERLKSSD